MAGKKKKTQEADLDVPVVSNVSQEEKDMESLAKAAGKYRDRGDLSRATLLYKQVALKAEQNLKKKENNSNLHRIAANAYFSLATHHERPEDLSEATDEQLKQGEELHAKALKHFARVDNKPADGSLPLHHALTMGGLATIRAAKLSLPQVNPVDFKKASIQDAQASPLNVATASPFILLSHALSKIEEAISKFKVGLLLSLQDKSGGLSQAQAEAAEGLENAYEAPSHFMSMAHPLPASERLAIADHIITMADGFNGNEGRAVKAEATLEAGESMADIVEEQIEAEEVEDPKAELEKYRDSDVLTSAIDYLRKAVALYTKLSEEAKEGEDPDQAKFHLGRAIFRLEQLLPPDSPERDNLVKELEKLDLTAVEDDEDGEWEDDESDGAHHTACAHGCKH